MNKKITLIAFIVILIILVAIFIKSKINAQNNINKNLDSNPNSQPDPLTNSHNKPVTIKASSITTPNINKIYFNNIHNGGSFPISKGQKSKLVYLQQYALNALFNTGLSIDGDFGSKTQAALLNHTGKSFADQTLVLALNSLLQENKSKIKNISFFENAIKYYQNN